MSEVGHVDLLDTEYFVSYVKIRFLSDKETVRLGVE